MKSIAKTKSFHVTVRGNFLAACDFPEPDTYRTNPPTSGWQRFDIISGIIT